MNRAASPVPAFATTRLFRRLVLGTAFFLGLAVALGPRSPAVHAQEPKSPPPAATAVPQPPSPKSAPKSLSITDGKGGEIKIDVTEGSQTSVTTDAPGARSDAAPAAPEAGRRGKKPPKITMDGMDMDREFDSFDEFVNNEPALFAMVVAVVAVVFFAPVLAIALILWYRMRKARMLNETMLKLAEKGIVPSADALDALAGGKQAAAVAPYYEQAKQVRRRAAWSDLRKGVLIGGIGLALSFHALFKSGGTNVVGLVLLFVGLGFVVLWWFEQRHLTPPGGVPREATPGPGTPPPINPPPT